MRQVLTFAGGVLVSAALMASAAYAAGFQRNVQQQQSVFRVDASPTTARFMWEVYDAAEKTVPDQLRSCVTDESRTESQRRTTAYQRDMVGVLERALDRCVSKHGIPTLAKK
jgi:hypothetical protein